MLAPGTQPWWVDGAVRRTRPVGRYAPSPSGRLHRGNLRTALLAHRQMEALGGTMILRMEDIDTPRVVPGAEDGILRDLNCLGLTYDEGGGDHPRVGGGSWRQSEREDFYWSCLEELGRLGLVYGCTCSRKDLREASAPHGPDGYIYQGTCRPAQVQKVSAADLRSGAKAWRLRTDLVGEVRFRDSLRGWVIESPGVFGDFVIRRRDGLWAYQLACAVDDWQMGVSHVLRGEDLFSSTARQIAVLTALGMNPPPHWCHVPLVLDGQGQKLSKRDGSAGLPEEAWSGCPDPEKWQAWVLGP